MGTVECGDFAHHGVDFAGLDVRDVDIGRMVQSCQFLAEHGRAQVAADARQLALLVAECRSRSPDAAMRMPCRRVHSAGLGPVSPVKMKAPRLATGAPSTAKPTAGTVCSAGSTSMRRSPSVIVCPTSNGFELEQRCLGRRQPREVGPDHAVENVGAQRVDGGGQRVHLDRRASLRDGASRCRPASRWTARGRGANG